jgi:hypothetical protein
MFCTNCGNEIEPQANFCSKCGASIAGAAPGPPPPPAQAPGPAPRVPRVQRDMQMHVTILAWLFIGSGILTGLVAFVLILIGQIVTHAPFPVPPDVPPGMPHFASWVLAMIGLGMLALAAGTAAAGVGLLQYRNWGRTLTIIMSVFMLFSFPIGTAIGVYGFWVLFSQEGREFYKSRATDTMTESGI